jgi:hypothetical protein
MGFFLSNNYLIFVLKFLSFFFFLSSCLTKMIKLSIVPYEIIPNRNKVKKTSASFFFTVLISHTLLITFFSFLYLYLA